MKPEDIERQIIGKLFIDTRVYFDNVELFNTYEFTGVNKPIIAEILREIPKGKLSVVGISKAVSGSFASKSEALNYVSNCRAQVDNNESTDEQLMHLIENRNTNLMIRGTQVLQAMAIAGDDPDSIRKKADELFKSVQNATNEVKPFIEHIRDVIAIVDTNRTQEKPRGIRTGQSEYDKFTGGMQLTDLEIIAGKSSMGKTAFVLGRVRNVAAQGIPVAVFNYEMSPAQLTARIMSKDAGISGKEILMFKLDDQKIGNLHTAIGKVQDYPIYIPKLKGSSLQEFNRVCRMMAMRYGVQYVVVDFIQRMKILGYRDRTQEIGDIGKGLKDIALELNIKVDALSQLSRDKNNEGREPILADLRQSGELEEAADIVTLLHRPEYYLKQDAGDWLGKAKIIIAKGRNIGTTDFRMGYNADVTDFYNLDTYEIKKETMQPMDINPDKYAF